MKDQVTISYRYATDGGPVEGTWTGDPLTAFWQGQSAVQARPHKDDLIAGFWQTRWIYRPDELDQPDELDEPITVSADALAQLGAGLLDGHSYEELRDCWCADTEATLEGDGSLPEPTLLDLIEVIDDGEVYGLTGALRRIAEMLAHQHERLTALEEGYGEPIAERPGPTEPEEGLKRCDGCRHFQKSSPTGELSALVGWCSLPGDSGAVRTSFCCDDWAPAEPDDEPVPYWPTEPGGDKRNELVQRVIEFRDARDGDGDGDLEEQRMFDVLAEITGESPPDDDCEPERPVDRIRWCSCGQPWIPAAGLYGTTEEMQCHACTLRAAKKRLEAERDSYRNLSDEADVKLEEALGECELGRVTLAKIVRLNRELDEQGELTSGYKLLRIPTPAHDELCDLLTELRDKA